MAPPVGRLEVRVGKVILILRADDYMSQPSALPEVAAIDRVMAVEGGQWAGFVSRDGPGVP